MSKIRLLKFNWIKISAIVFSLVLLASYTQIFAIASPYDPGATLDPECAPGDENCTVNIASQWLNSGTSLYYDSGNVGIGTDYPTSALTIKGNYSVIGEDLITNGTFTGGTTGWVINEATYGDNNVIVTYTNDVVGETPEITTDFITESGKTYLISFTLSDVINDSVFTYFYENGFYNDVQYKNGTHTIIFTADFTGTDTIVFSSWEYNDNSFWTIDDVSVKELESSSPSVNILDQGGNNLLTLGDNYLGNFFVGLSAGYGISGDAVYHSTFIGNEAGASATGAYQSNFIGRGAGKGATNAFSSTFIGDDAGGNSSNANNSVFLGNNSGSYSTDAPSSVFIGASAGTLASSASNSVFLGKRTGERATNAQYSNFIGTMAGFSATAARDSNFIGTSAGYQATNAARSIMIGFQAGYQDTVNNTLNVNDSSILIGNNTKTGGFKNSVLIGSSANGTPISNTKINQFMLAPALTEMRLRGVDYTLPSSQGGASTVLTNNGSGVLSWVSPAAAPITVVNSSNLFSTGLTQTGNGVTATTYSNFMGPYSGYQATSASNSNFLGYNSGRSATSASSSNFFGNSAGYNATSASNSNFIGASSGNAASSAQFSNFLGFYAGSSATNASSSNFIGRNSGENATGAANSNFMGYYSGTSAAQASNSIFIGQRAGYQDTVNNTGSSYDWSILLGYNTNTGGYKNSVLIGGSSGPSAISNTKINQFMLAPTLTEMRLRGVDYTLPSSQGGASTVLTNNGSGVLSWSSPATSPITIVNSSNLFSTGLTGTGNGVTLAGHSIFLGQNAGNMATNAYRSNFFGEEAGYIATSAQNSNLLGYQAGYSASGAYGSNFIGSLAGKLATNANQSNFIGVGAGESAAESPNSNFIGYYSGYGATSASTSNFIGRRSGYGATSASGSNFMGVLAGEGATDAYSSNFIGSYSGEGSTGAYYSNFIGNNAGNFALSAHDANFIGNYAGAGAENATHSVFIGTSTGDGAVNASNSIFLGVYAGLNDTVNNTTDGNDFSILIGNSTGTGGFENSIALGGGAVNTASNQFMIGSTTRPVDTTRWNGSASTQCTLTTGTGIACTSDENLKTNINDLDNTILEKLLNVRTVTFNWKEGNSDKQNIGFLAQDLENYFPELVSTDQDGYKSVYYANMTPILTEAIRELNLKLEDLNIFDSTEPGFMSMLFNTVVKSVSNGIAYMKDIVVDSLKVGSSEKRTGITLYDELTGEPYCLSISGGETKTVQGECGVIIEQENEKNYNSEIIESINTIEEENIELITKETIEGSDEISTEEIQEVPTIVNEDPKEEVNTTEVVLPVEEVHEEDVEVLSS